MHYTPRVTFQEPIQKIRGSLPDLRPDCVCGCSRYVSSAGGRTTATGRQLLSRYGDSCGSTESLIDEADDYLRKSVDGALIHDNDVMTVAVGSRQTTTATRRCSENDLKKGIIANTLLSENIMNQICVQILVHRDIHCRFCQNRQNVSKLDI